MLGSCFNIIQCLVSPQFYIIFYFWVFNSSAISTMENFSYKGEFKGGTFSKCFYFVLARVIFRASYTKILLLRLPNPVSESSTLSSMSNRLTYQALSNFIPSNPLRRLKRRWPLGRVWLLRVLAIPVSYSKVAQAMEYILTHFVLLKQIADKRFFFWKQGFLTSSKPR